MKKASRSYQKELLKALKDSKEAAAYLDAALADGSNELFLMALRNIAEARGMKKLAEDVRLNRESMYRMLSEKGNPRLSSLSPILEKLGLRLSIQPV